MNCKREAERIAANIQNFARRNPRVSHCTQAEMNGMLNFLSWVHVALGAASVRDGGALFKLYAMRTEGANWN